MGAGETQVKVWDAPVRLFHWLLVLLFAFSFFTGKAGSEWTEWHMRSGYTILGLLLFRVMWGFAGSTHARFASFLAGPAASGIRRSCSRAGALPDTTPAADGAAVASLFQTHGLFANDDVFGRAAVRCEQSDLDQLDLPPGTSICAAALGLHVIAVLYHAGFMKENLIGAMFTGVKRMPADAAGSVVTRFASPWLALVLLCVAALAVFLIVKRPF
jgi:cytochrome b